MESEGDKASPWMSKSGAGMWVLAQGFVLQMIPLEGALDIQTYREIGADVLLYIYMERQGSFPVLSKSLNWIGGYNMGSFCLRVMPSRKRKGHGKNGRFPLVARFQPAQLAGGPRPRSADGYQRVYVVHVHVWPQAFPAETGGVVRFFFPIVSC